MRGTFAKEAEQMVQEELLVLEKKLLLVVDRVVGLASLSYKLQKHGRRIYRRCNGQ